MIMLTTNIKQIQQYIISIIENDFQKSIELFWYIFKKDKFREFIIYNVLILLERQLDELEYYKFMKLNYQENFTKIFQDQNELSHILQSLLDKCSKLDKENLQELTRLSTKFHPIEWLHKHQQSSSTASDQLLEIWEFTCQYLTEHHQHQYTLLLYLQSCKYLKPSDTTHRSYWSHSIATLDQLSTQFQMDTNHQLFLMPMNRLSIPFLFGIQQHQKEDNLFTKWSKDDLIKFSWKFLVCQTSDISNQTVRELQGFLQGFVDQSLTFTNAPKRFHIDLMNGDLEAIRNDYFDRNQDSSQEEEQSDDHYLFEMQLGIYLLSSLFYICSWRYFKFLVTGSPEIQLNTTSMPYYSQTSSGSSPVTLATLSVFTDKENVISSRLCEVKSQKTYMITHQVLLYSNVEDETQFKDEAKSIPKTPLQKEAIKYLTLCMDCYNDLNQEPWVNAFTEILDNLWFASPNFYWMLNSVADGNYYYESYSQALKLYKQVKSKLSTNYHSQTLIPIFENKKLLFNPKDDVWINRLFLMIGMTNHSEIEESIVYLLDILLSVPIPDRLVTSQYTYQTMKPFLTVYSEDEILFWAINALSACYERMGMVGEMIVLYQSYWEFYKPRFHQIINEIRLQSNINSNQQNVDNNNSNLSSLIPLSNLSKKDLQKGFFFPRFFDYIINLDMLEEFCFLLNQGIKLDILHRDQQVQNNRQLVNIIADHITSTSKTPGMSLGFLLNKFFQEELDHFESKRESNNNNENDIDNNNNNNESDSQDVEMKD
ncbi:hypothetical protein DLAC_01231 [Tieghemostelium lacteum]|uniref:Uncharacterized protein n=1 Tax=Tieghemostelium lacteum TaxID=361077 RepID=A0A152A828_TIELA|nr:hypothetical protein DLAC_01231 [Tieghemostelium lacteum]|eukprot:KYR02392.1 hypothetical protein DLAC_01231 [Tieghemostelium lacteum]